MYGDVFGNRVQDSSLPGLESSDPVETPSYQWQPALDLSRRAPKYGYDPWTKAAYRFDARIRWWCFLPDNPVWHAAVQYGVGSILFVIGSIAALFPVVGQSPVLNRWLVGYTYFVGSINYGIGASILLYESWINHPSNLSDPYTQATPQRTAAITISRVGSFATADGGVRGSVDQVAGSFEDVTAAENVSRPPSFASTHRYWPSGPDLPDPDAEASSYSLPQLAEAAGWGSLTRPSTGVDVDITQPLLENEVVLVPDTLGTSKQPNDVTKRSGELTTEATLTLSLPDDSAPGSPAAGGEKTLRVFTGRRAADSPSTWLHGVYHSAHRSREDVEEDRIAADGNGIAHMHGNGADTEMDVDSDDEGDRESVPCDETETARSFEGSFTSEPRSYHHVFGRRWRATSTAENVSTSLLDVPHRLPSQMNALVHSFYTRDAYYHVHADPWYKTRWLLDLGGSFAIWVGAVLYFVACLSTAYKVTYGHLPRIHPDPEVCEAVLGYWPDTIGGALFVVGSWLYWWAAHGTPGPLAPKPFTIEWVVSVVNLVGSVGFYYGAVTSATYVEVPGLVGNWVELLVGYVIGSALFAVGSYLMIVELASHSGG